MEIRKNNFRQSFLQKEVRYGIWNGLVDTYAAEILAGAGFDWIVIDAEHAPFDLRTILQQLQTLAGFDVPVLVRPPGGDTVFIKQLLDAGAQSLVIPMVETAEQASLMYKAMQYPPIGFRGLGTAMARAAQWNRVNNYMHTANNEMCLLVQVESLAGIQNLEAIVNTEGVDGVFIGPADLAASMGYIGRSDHPEVKKEVGKAIQCIRKAGKIAGVMALTKDLVAEYVQYGANMVAVAIDTHLLANTTSQLAASFKDKR